MLPLLLVFPAVLLSTLPQRFKACKLFPVNPSHIYKPLTRQVDQSRGKLTSSLPFTQAVVSFGRRTHHIGTKTNAIGVTFLAHTIFSTYHYDSDKSIIWSFHSSTLPFFCKNTPQKCPLAKEHQKFWPVIENHTLVQLLPFSSFTHATT